VVPEGTPIYVYGKDGKLVLKEDAEKEKQEKEFKAKQAQALKDSAEIDDTNA
jgi:hypothetical protein